MSVILGARVRRRTITDLSFTRDGRHRLRLASTTDGIWRSVIFYNFAGSKTQWRRLTLIESLQLLGGGAC